MRSTSSSWTRRSESMYWTEVAVLLGDHRGGAAQDQVAGEERPLLGQVVAEVVRGVPRRVDGHQRDAVGLDTVWPSRRSVMPSGRSVSLRIILATGRPGYARAGAHAAQVVLWRWVRSTRAGLRQPRSREVASRTAAPTRPRPPRCRSGSGRGGPPGRYWCRAPSSCRGSGRARGRRVAGVAVFGKSGSIQVMGSFPGSRAAG